MKPAAAVTSARRAGTTATFDQMIKHFTLHEMPIVSTRYWNMVHGAKPQDVFLDCVNQVAVDKSTEQWLDAIEGKLDYDRWYCGHYHVYKTIDKLRFLYNDFVELR